MFPAKLLTAIATVFSLACVRNAGPRLTEPVVVAFEQRRGVALVKVEVNGHPTLLILDTGSGAMVLDSAFAAVAQVEYSSGVRGTANGSAATAVRIGRLRTVRVGAASLSNAIVAVTDLKAVRERIGFDVHGAIGFELFERYVVDVNYDASTVTLSEPVEFTYRGTGTVLPVDLKARVPRTTASVVTRTKGTVEGIFLLDLGSSGLALQLNSRFVAAHDLEHDTVGVLAPLTAGVEGVSEGPMMRMPALKLGNLTILRPSTGLSRATTGSLSPTSAEDGIIGVAVFRRTHMIIDYSRARIILEPRGRLDIPDSVDASGLSLVEEEAPSAGIRVVHVIAGSAGAKAGVLEGDEIVRLDGIASSAVTLQGARDRLSADGAVRRLTLRRGGKTFDVVLTLKMLF